MLKCTQEQSVYPILLSNIPYIAQQYTLYCSAIYPILVYACTVKNECRPCYDDVAEAPET